MNCTILSVFFVVAQLSAVFSQNIHFGIFFKGDEVGTIEGTARVTDTVLNYTVISEVEYNSLLYDYQRTTILSTSFFKESHQLLACKSKVTKGDKLEEYKITRWKGGRYQAYGNDGTKFTLDTTITFTAGLLYFKEPKNQAMIFSESYQELCPIKHVGGGVYELTLPGNKTNHYIYENSKLKEVRVFRSFFNLTFSRK